jgi:hypothetical protein
MAHLLMATMTASTGEAPPGVDRDCSAGERGGTSVLPGDVPACPKQAHDIKTDNQSTEGGSKLRWGEEIK